MGAFTFAVLVFLDLAPGRGGAVATAVVSCRPLLNSQICCSMLKAGLGICHFSLPLPTILPTKVSVKRTRVRGEAQSNLNLVALVPSKRTLHGFAFNVIKGQSRSTKGKAQIGKLCEFQGTCHLQGLQYCSMIVEFGLYLRLIRC